MQSGEVKELGSHDELIGIENGLYSSLVHLQQSRYSMDPEKVGANTSTYVSQQSSSQHMTRGFSTASKSSPTKSMDDANQENPNLPVPSFRMLLMLNAPEWKQALMGSFSAIVFGAIQPVFAFAMGSMISVYFLTDHEEIKKKTRTYALISVGLGVLTFLISIGQHYNFFAMGEYLTKRVRERMLAKFLTFEIGWFDQDENSSSSICSQLTKDANTVSTNKACKHLQESNT
jgi:ATP-binding cassette subfamily B (MDR/TAP) protein 1